MPINLDLKSQKEKDKAAPQSQKKAADLPEKKEAASAKTKQTAKKSASSVKRGQGRPKGDPVVTRSLRIKEDIDQRFVARHEATKMSYNDMVNEALDAYLK